MLLYNLGQNYILKKKMSKIRCDHCHLSYEENILIKDDSFKEVKLFCCKGCQGIYHLLNEEGLGSFYEKMGTNTIEPPKEGVRDFEKFNLDGFREHYVKQKDGFCEISLIIEGIHCAACVWLNERVLHKADGVIEASVNGTNHKAKIIWDDEVIKLSQIIEIIQSIGYTATPYDPKLQEEHANAKRREYNARLLVAVFATMNIMWIAIAQYTGFFTGMRSDIKNILNFAEFILATPALFYTGWVFFRGAYYGLKNRHVNMDFLVATGASLAYLYSVYAMFSERGEVYFDSVTMIITFVFAGKYLEILTQKRAVDTLDGLVGSLPTEVTIIKNFKKQNQEKIITPLANVQINDILELKAGEKAVIDGTLISGEASFDTSSITGENKPILKKQNDEIISGTLCLDGVVHYKAKVLYKDSMLSKITNLLEESMTKKPRIEQLANQISGYFSLIILSLALLTFLGWFWFDGDFEHALIVGIAVIVIACPCALGLATPVSTLVGLGISAKKGVLFKEATYLESMAKSSILVLDKTGTITEGKPKVIKETKFSQYDKNLLFSLLKTSEHPVSKGVLEYLKNEELKEVDLQNIKAISSKGVKANYENKQILGGSKEFLKENGVDIKKDEETTSYWFSIDGKLASGFFLEDSPREGANEVIKGIKDLHVKTLMLTGDNEISAKNIASNIGLEDFHSSLNPLQKAKHIDSLHVNKEIVVMAGDGINDALALSKSDIAIAMGSGSDVALNVSDVVLLNDNLKSLLFAFKISKKVYKTIKQNLGFSVIYNTLTIPLAMAGFINPLFAALSMSLSSIVVVLNSMRIKRIIK